MYQKIKLHKTSELIGIVGIITKRRNWVIPTITKRRNWAIPTFSEHRGITKRRNCTDPIIFGIWDGIIPS